MQIHNTLEKHQEYSTIYPTQKQAQQKLQELQQYTWENTQLKVIERGYFYKHWIISFTEIQNNKTKNYIETKYDTIIDNFDTIIQKSNKELLHAKQEYLNKTNQIKQEFTQEIETFTNNLKQELKWQRKN